MARKNNENRQTLPSPPPLGRSIRFATPPNPLYLGQQAASGSAFLQAAHLCFQLGDLRLQLHDLVGVIRLRLGSGQTLPQRLQPLFDDFVSLLRFFIHSTHPQREYKTSAHAAGVQPAYVNHYHHAMERAPSSWGVAPLPGAPNHIVHRTVAVNNADIAEVFDELADLLEFAGENPFRVRAYRSGAHALRQLDESVLTISQTAGRRLADIPGIGQTLAEKTLQLLQNGSLPQLDELRQRFPPSVLAMVRIPGLGAKKAARLHQELQIQSLDDLRSVCQEGAVAKLKGFGAKSQQMILDGLAIAESAGKRVYWAKADRWAEELRSHLTKCSAIEQLELAGSYRRGRDTVGDLDVLVVASDRQAAIDHFEAFPRRTQTIARGEEKVSIRIAGAFQVDLRLVQPHQFGAALQYFTGSKEHNLQLRRLAQAQGLKINEYGVFPSSDPASGGADRPAGGADSAAPRPIAGTTEAEVYAAVGCRWIPPELREGRQEIRWAQQATLPELIQLSDIRGDLHMHTSATDGSATIREMADAAIERGLQYIAITDHSQRVAMAGGLNPERLRQQWRMIDEIRPQYEGRLTILKGIECDILEAGGMDLPDDCLAEADWVLASVHYGQRQSRQQITDRVIGAIENRFVHCIAHPTGRLILRREAYEVDLEAIFQAAAEHHTAMELNANPARLDLNDVHAAMAKRFGILLVINSDAHSTEGLDVMRYGVLQARRAGLTAADVLNTRGPANLLAEPLKP